MLRIPRRFPRPLRTELLALPSVGERVVSRLERAGFDSIEQLAQWSLPELIGCLERLPVGAFDRGVWARSSLARNAIQTVLGHARASVAGKRTSEPPRQPSNSPERQSRAPSALTRKKPIPI